MNVVIVCNLPRRDSSSNRMMKASSSSLSISTLSRTSLSLVFTLHHNSSWSSAQHNQKHLPIVLVWNSLSKVTVTITLKGTRSRSLRLHIFYWTITIWIIVYYSNHMWRSVMIKVHVHAVLIRSNMVSRREIIVHCTMISTGCPNYELSIVGDVDMTPPDSTHK